MDTGDGWIGRNEALRRLGIKTQTLYAYVSRGRIAARPDPADPRRSLYAERDIERLEAGERVNPAPGLARGATSRGETELFSSLSTMVDGRLFHAGMDAAQLASQVTVEDLARRLWGLKSARPLQGLKPRVDAVTGASIRMRVHACLARRAAEDAVSVERDREVLGAEAAGIFNEVIDAAAGSGPRLLFHQRLARGWKLIERDADLARRALVLCADDLDPGPILAARSASQAGAPLSGAVLAGLVALSGTRLMTETRRASTWVAHARRDPALAIERSMAESGTVPGTLNTDDEAWQGHHARNLIDHSGLWPDLDTLCRRIGEMTGRKPGLALALALVARRLDLPRDGACDLLLLGRLSGLFGHVVDQAANGSPIRARLRYVGPAPGSH